MTRDDFGNGPGTQPVSTSMMLGSVFNRYHASTNSESSKAPQTRLRTFRIGRDAHPFSEFKGLGPPGLNIGLRGDIYIDLTPGRYALYARYPDSWRLWPGPKDVSTLLLHPMHVDRCLWCNEMEAGWYHRKNIKVNPSGTASEILSEALKHQVALSEESRKRKRDALEHVHQPMQTASSSTANIPGPSQNRALENQSPTDALSFLRSTTSTTPGYSQPSLEIMIPSSTLISTTAPTTQNSEYCTGPPNTDPLIPTESDQVFTSKDLTQRSERNLQEQSPSPKRIDLREFAKKRKAASSTHGVDAGSISYQRNARQSFPQPGFISSLPCVVNKPSIQDRAHATNLDMSSFPKTSRILTNDDPLLDQSQSIIANSTLMLEKTHANNSDLHISPANKTISFSLSHVTEEGLIGRDLPDPAPLASTDQELPYNEEHLTTGSPLEKPALENFIDNERILDTSIAELRRMKDPSDINATYVRAANDKIRRLEAENARLRAQLLIRCQCNSSCDIPPMVTNVDMPPPAESDALNCALHENNSDQVQKVGASQSQRETVGNIPSGSQLHSSCHPHIESSSALRLSETPPTSLSLTDRTVLTEITPSAHITPLLESGNTDHRNSTDIFQVESCIPLLEFRAILESSVNSPPVKEEIAGPKSWHAPSSSVPTSMSLRMREIHRSVLFAKAGSLLICRICLGTKLGGVETVDQTFKTTEGSSELMQEHCEKEHPKDCEALVNMRDEELLELVSMITPDC